MGSRDALLDFTKFLGSSLAFVESYQMAPERLKNMQRIMPELIHGFSIRKIYGSLKFVSLGNAGGYFVALIGVIKWLICTFIDLKQTLHILQNPPSISKK